MLWCSTLGSRVTSVAGTLPYYSPEMCRGERYGEKVDVWALGCVVYELTTLSHPFHRDGDNMVLLPHKIRRGMYDPISSFYSAAAVLADPVAAER